MVPLGTLLGVQKYSLVSCPSSLSKLQWNTLFYFMIWWFSMIRTAISTRHYQLLHLWMFKVHRSCTWNCCCLEIKTWTTVLNGLSYFIRSFSFLLREWYTLLEFEPLYLHPFNCLLCIWTRSFWIFSIENIHKS